MQTGFGRTGRMFAIEHYGVEPDLMTLAKSIAAGLPLSAVVGKAEIMDCLWDGAIGGTYVGNPGRARRRGGGPRRVRGGRRSSSARSRSARRFGPGCSPGRSASTAIGDVRGLGAMLAVEYVEDRATKEPAPAIATRVAEEAPQRGLLLLKAGIHSNCNRVLCPLVITDAELEEALGAWEDALEACTRP